MAAKLVKTRASKNQRVAHVVRNVSGKWSVRKTGSHKPYRVFDSLQEAIDHATNTTSSDKEFVIHGRNGRVQSIIRGGKAVAGSEGTAQVAG